MNQEAIRHLDVLVDEVGKALQFQSIQYHLFDEDKKVDTLNNMCPEIWGVVSDALWDATIAAVGRLCDNGKVAGNQNITVYTVANEFDPTGQLASDIAKLLNQYKSAKCSVIQYRHKTVAHPDAATRLGDPGKGKLVSIRTSEIDDVLWGMTKAIAAITNFAELSEYNWDHFIEARTDSFFDIIRAGQVVIGEIP